MSPYDLPAVLVVEIGCGGDLLVVCSRRLRLPGPIMVAAREAAVGVALLLVNTADLIGLR